LKNVVFPEKNSPGVKLKGRAGRSGERLEDPQAAVQRLAA